MEERRTTNELIRKVLGDGRKTKQQIVKEFLAFLGNSSEDGVASPEQIKRRPMLTFTFDDGNVEDYTTAFPILESAGMRGTYFCIGSAINTSTYLSEEQMKEMADHGQEIACHTYNHVRLTEHSDSDILREISENKKTLESITKKPVLTFSAPYNQWNHHIESLIGGFYESARRGRGTSTVPAQMEYGHERFFKICLWGHNASVQEIKNEIDIARRDGTWLVLGFHRINNDVDNPLSVSSENFQEIVDYASSFKVSGSLDVVPFYEGSRRIHL